jgi:hypothetical protein
MIGQFTQHFTMILTLIFSNGQVQVQTLPGFASYATCTLAGEQIIARVRINLSADASYQCVLQ